MKIIIFDSKWFVRAFALAKNLLYPPEKPVVIEVPKKQAVFILSINESRGGNLIKVNGSQISVYNNNTILYCNSGQAVACYGESGNYKAIKDKLIKMLQDKELRDFEYKERS